MRSWTLLVPWLAVGCDPLEAYWEPVDTWPVITGVSPDRVDHLLGGEIVEIRGVRLATARTVLIGSRNAEILDREDRRVIVRVPQAVAGGGDLDLSVVTDAGYARLEDAFRYDALFSDVVAEEVASAALLRFDCPIEAAVEQANGRPTRLFWCGAEAGLGYGFGYLGTSPQPGFAGDIVEITPLSLLPAIGDIAVFEPGADRAMALPLSFAAHGPDDTIEITTRRDLAWDLAFAESRLDLAARSYTWAFAVDQTSALVATLFSDDSCLLIDPQLLQFAEGDSVVLTEVDPLASSVQIGFSWTESYDDGSTDFVSAVTGTTTVTTEGNEVFFDHAGGVLGYNAFSGFYETRTVAGLEGNGNLIPEADYDVVVTDAGVASTLGDVIAPPELVVTSPDLLVGDTIVRRDRDLTVAWEPFPGDPSFLAIELRFDDYDVAGPNGPQEAWRLVAHANPVAGTFTIPASQLAGLPRAPNALDPNFDLVGMWAELSVATHTLRRVEMPDGGDLVVDFMHVVNSPVRVR